MAAEANKGYKTKEGRDSVARTLDNPNRDKNQKPEEIIAAMRIEPGMTVADIGTGTGYMLPFLSRAVGEHGKVIGEDIQNDFLDHASARIKENHIANAQLILGTETDPKLPAGAVDQARTSRVPRINVEDFSVQGWNRNELTTKSAPI